MRNAQAHASLFSCRKVMEQKLIAAWNEFGDTRAESAGAQLAGKREACMKAVQPRSTL